jgi:hypothetical protein
LADLQANAALLSVKLGKGADGFRLARAGIPVLKQTALKADASASELNLAARFLTQREFPELCDAKLGLQLAQRANASAAGKDYVLLETLGQAYWLNGDRADAVRSMEGAVGLVGTAPAGSRVRRLFDKRLAGYRVDRLPAGCGTNGLRDQAGAETKR